MPSSTHQILSPEARLLRHQAIFDSAVDFAIMAFNDDGQVTDWNKGATYVFGWTAEEMQGQAIDRIFTPSDRAQNRLKIEMRKAVTEGRASDERWHMRKDGSLFWASGEMVPLLSNDGAHIGFLKILTDRNSAREATEAQRHDAEFLRSVLAASTDCIKVMELDGQLLFMNEAGLKAMDVGDFNDVRGRAWPDFWEGDARLKAESAVATAMAGGVGRFVGHVNTSAGARKWWDVQMSAMLGSDGKPVRLLSIARDVTAEHVQNEAAPAAEQPRPPADADAPIDDRELGWKLSPDLQMVIDVGGRIQLANEAWTQVLGWGQQDLLHRDQTEFMHPDDEDWVALVRQEPDQHQVFERRYRHRTGDYRWISWAGTVRNGVVYASGRHVTAEKEHAALLESAAEQLRQSQKMEAVGQLTGGLAHDFNNILAAVSVSLELINRRVGSSSPELERYVSSARESVKRAASLTHRLLAFARRQPLDPKPVDANRLVASMEDLLRRTIGPAVTLEVVGAGGLWPVLVDPNQLENAILNLCLNARDAMMPSGGRLTIETANKWFDSRESRPRDVPPGQYISLCVTDTGSGMGPDVIKHIFDPFFTTKPMGMGTGLGLSMVYGFARQSGGQIRVYSEPGQGTTMCIYLPRHHGEVSREEGYGGSVPVSGSGETIMVVDDDPAVRMLTTDLLHELGYQWIAADGSVGALKLLESDTKVDLLVTDVGLPGGMNGRQLAERARQLRPTLNVLFITGYAENALLGNGVLEPGMQVLTKPFTMDGLGAKVQDLLAMKS